MFLRASGKYPALTRPVQKKGFLTPHIQNPSSRQPVPLEGKTPSSSSCVRDLFCCVNDYVQSVNPRMWRIRPLLKDTAVDWRLHIVDNKTVNA